ncbi:MAG: acetyl-CoA carboxylase biotin carboxylase subunit [Deltaproteobacteria bacterium]|nr:acetyl-CoA carboxylase biotin carboxylase subunit [Deltaproteobacteria bacterium]
MKIRRLLIANRGEIAVRIIRACQELGITACAVYADADATALHVRLADEAYHLGPTAPAESYLSIPRLLAVAKEANVDAIHPGYGFLAENADFAAAVAKARWRWVGPPAAIIRRLGSKTAARKLAQAVKIPMVPGATTPVRSIPTAGKLAETIGYPVLLKAVAGGGGKGMRIVRTAPELSRAFDLAQGEARNAFGNGDLYLEKYIDAPHHIEVQILADHHGHIIHLGERECSVQRRHQKLIEETPSPFLTENTRRAICRAALRLMKAARYRNAGTVEFLVDHQQRFYFLEVNTRIQVEHPITELVTGIDLICEQLRISAGEPLRWSQRGIHNSGHAIECRICAEDPAQNFIPTPGFVTDFMAPHGHGIRIDCGIVAGSTIPMEYDPLVGKLCTWGATREVARAKMVRALQELRISGTITNVHFHLNALQHPLFLKGNYSTQFVERERASLLTAPIPNASHAVIVAAIAKALHQTDPTHAASAAPHPSAWKISARQQGVQHGMEFF